MEFNEKLQELRKQKALTQEELAEALYVSRTAVSKWESGRGYPNIDSLKEIAKFFGVSMDALLSGEELLSVAEEDNKHKEMRFRDMVYGLLDVAVAMFFFLPFFRQTVDGRLQEVSLLSLTEIAPYLRVAFLTVAIAMVLLGLLTLALQSCSAFFWVKNKGKASLLLSAVGVLLFIISSQPYAAAFLFVFLAIKSLILLKWQ